MRSAISDYFRERLKSVTKGAEAFPGAQDFFTGKLNALAESRDEVMKVPFSPDLTAFLATEKQKEYERGYQEGQDNPVDAEGHPFGPLSGD